VYSLTLKLHSSSGVVVRNKLLSPNISNIAKHFCLAYLAASSEWPTDQHDVLTAFKNALVFESSVSKLCSSTFSKSSSSMPGTNASASKQTDHQDGGTGQTSKGGTANQT